MSALHADLTEAAGRGSRLKIIIFVIHQKSVINTQHNSNNIPAGQGRGARPDTSTSVPVLVLVLILVLLW